MKLLALLVGMVLVLEGLPYVAAPEAMQTWLKKVSETEPSHLRTLGFIAMVVGFAICLVVQKTSFLQ